MERDIIVKLGVIEKVLDKSVCMDLYETEPFVYKLLMDKFKEFLNDDYFEAVERQLVLHKFLKNNYPLEISRDVIDFINSSSLKEDYTRVIMEWNLYSSEYNRMYNLYRFDGCQMAMSKPDFQASKPNNSVVPLSNDLLSELTEILLEDISYKDEGGE